MVDAALRTLQAADAGMSAITKLVQSAQALGRQAQQTTDATERATLATQFDATLTQIDLLAADSGFNGKDIINGDDLTVVFNEDGTSTLTITGDNKTKTYRAANPTFTFTPSGFVNGDTASVLT